MKPFLRRFQILKFRFYYLLNKIDKSDQENLEDSNAILERESS